MKKLLLLLALTLPVSAASIKPNTLMCDSEMAIESIIDGYQTGNQHKVNAFTNNCTVFDKKFDVDVIDWSYFTSFSNIRIYDEYGYSDWWVVSEQIIVK